MSQRKYLPFLGTVIVALAMLCPVARAATLSQGTSRASVPDVQNYDAPFWWAQIDFTKPHNVPWDESDFATLAQSGVNGVEINMLWADIEPQKDRYDFKLLDRYMAEAAKAHLKIYPLFWESLWQEDQGKNPPPWITARDVSSDGFAAQEPPWWDNASRKAYFDYVAHTIDHVKVSPGFGGVYASYQATDKLSLNLRGEYEKFDTTTSNQGEEVTATVQYNLWANVISRAEFRWDHAAHGTQFGSNDQNANAYLVALNLIYQF